MEKLAELQSRKNKLLSHLPYTKVVPAILTNDVIDFQHKVREFMKITDRIDIDFINDTLIDGEDTLSLEEVTELLKEFDIRVGYHFMTSYFDLDLVRRNTKVENIVIEAKLMHEEEGFINDVMNMILEKNRKVRVGISFDPDDDIKGVADVLRHFDFVQLMTVVPGKQGGSFHPEVIKNLDFLFKEGISTKLDGSINEEHLDSLLPEERELVRKVDEVSVGSYFSEIFKS